MRDTTGWGRFRGAGAAGSLSLGVLALTHGGASCSPFGADPADDVPSIDAGDGADGAGIPESGSPDEAGAGPGDAGPSVDAAACYPGARLCETFPTGVLPSASSGWTVLPSATITKEACKEGDYCLRTTPGASQVQAGLRHAVRFDPTAAVVVDLWARVNAGSQVDVVEVRGASNHGAYLGLSNGAWTFGVFWSESDQVTGALGRTVDGDWHRFHLEVRSPNVVSGSVDGVDIPLSAPPPASFSLPAGTAGTVRAGVYSTARDGEVDVDVVSLSPGALP